MNPDQLTHRLTAGESPDALLQREWLLTAGNGSYAMGTALGCPTRRYHALLVAATQPPVGRIVLLNQMLERLHLRPAGEPANRESEPTQTLELSTCQFRDDQGQRVFAPQGCELLQQFERGLTVTWHYRWGSIRIRRQLLLHWGGRAATLRYRITGLATAGSAATLSLAPMVSLRDFHSVLRADDFGQFVGQHGTDRLTLERLGHQVCLHCPAGRFQPNEHWWYRLHYPIESRRGQEDAEDLFVPGAFECEAADATEIELTAALGETPVSPMQRAADRAEALAPTIERLGRLEQTAAGAGGSPRAAESSEATATALAIAADDFIVQRRLGGEDLMTILAGYPWFADWGRDTFIALPGLLLATGRHQEAQRVLRVFAEAIDRGLVPNRFDDYTEAAAHYNTVDASLWFIHAARRYVKMTGDRRSWNDWLAPACLAIVDAYSQGTGGDGSDRALIGMAEDGLITAGNERTQLTWMDARCGDQVFTPRPGKAVEINALWYSALSTLAEELPPAQAERASQLGHLANKVKRHYAEVFWEEPAGYLVDHLYHDAEGRQHRDISLRPNQLLACALPHSPLGKEKRRRAVQAVTDHLLTPAGLRTLPQDDPNYHGHYRGDQFQRDKAYHQGTIWPWLLGPYCEAVLRTGEFSKAASQHARQALAPLRASLTDGPGSESLEPGPVGQLAEIYAADPDEAGRFRPRGCPAQAWSVAELIRIQHLLSEGP
jgi:predicted glycogen debranching enzyme